MNSFPSIVTNSSNGGSWRNGLPVNKDICCNSFEHAGCTKYFRSKVAFHCLISFDVGVASLFLLHLFPSRAACKHTGYTSMLRVGDMTLTLSCFSCVTAARQK